MKRKLLSLILVAAMLASMLVFTPAAGAVEAVATVQTTDAIGAVGDEVTVDVIITAAEVKVYQLIVEYDHSKLQLTGWAAGSDKFIKPTLMDENAAFKQFTKVGPYSLIAGGTANGNIAVDCSAGEAAATLTFKIKDGATIGDTEVICRYLLGSNPSTGEPLRPSYIGDQNNNYTEEEGAIEFIGSTVTILPAEYYGDTPNAAADFNFDPWDANAGDYADSWDTATGAGIYEYVGTDTDVIIPEKVWVESEGKFFDVQLVDTLAFNGVDVTSIVIPSTVDIVATMAIVNCESLTDVYVLGNDTEFDKGSIGWTATYSSRKGWQLGAILLDENSAALTTIHGCAGSTAETYAATADDAGKTLGWSTEGKVLTGGFAYTLNFGDKTAWVPANVKAPGMTVIGGALVVGWSDGANTYAVGEAMTLTADTTLTPVTVNAPTTKTDVDFRPSDEASGYGMRFQTVMGYADYKTLKDLGVKVELGMLITPAAYVSLAGDFTKEALSALAKYDAKTGTATPLGSRAYVDVPVNGYFTKDDAAEEYTFAASIENFSDTTIAKNPAFASVLYATVTLDDNSTFTVYGEYNSAADWKVSDAAQAILDKGGLTNNQKNWLEELVGRFNGAN